MYKMIKANLVKIMKDARKSAGFNQSDIARVMKISQSNYSKMERGLLIPNVIQWVLFCDATGISVDSLKKTT